MQELYNRFQQLAEEYSSLKLQCEAGVKVWRLATSSLADPRPFYYERNRVKPGRFLKIAPANPGGKHEYGYDDLGRVMVERMYVDTTVDWGVRYYENFYTYQGDIIESAYFSYHSRKDPINCKRSTYLDGKIILWEFQVKRSSFRERYYWRDDKVTLIEIERIDFENLNIFAEPKPYQKIDPKYNISGLIEELILYQNAQSNLSQEAITLYRRLDRKTSSKKLLNLVKDGLIESIIHTVGTLKLEEPVYCIAISWSPGQFSSLPPYIWIGLNREREQWLKEHGDEAKMYFWNPSEFSVYSDLNSNEDLIKLCETLNQECGLQDNWDNIAKMLNEVAKLLGIFDWSEYFQATSDFVVFSSDLEGSDMQKNFDFSVSSKLRKQFKKIGWLPYSD
jgi:hypothetical protein